MTEKKHIIAWQGWEFPIDEDWQPMKIEGDHHDGSMMIGLTDHPLMQIKWKRFRKDPPLCAEDWLIQRFHPQKLSASPPLPQGFASAAWIFDHAGRGDRRISVWSGVNRTERTVIEIMLTDMTPQEYQTKIFHTYLPEMRLYGSKEEWKWALYDIEFTVPGNYILAERHLYSGDIALLFRDRKRRQLLLRQVYPAKLALDKRSLQRWLDVGPFTVRRRFRQEKEQQWDAENKAISGIRRCGYWRIPFPLAWIKPRPTTAIAANDQKLDRLLIAEYSSPKQVSEPVVEKSIIGMNASYHEKA